jgi:hypothetical protein
MKQTMLFGKSHLLRAPKGSQLVGLSQKNTENKLRLWNKFKIILFQVYCYMVLRDVAKLWLPKLQLKLQVYIKTSALYFLFLLCLFTTYPTVKDCFNWSNGLFKGCRFINVQVSSLTNKWYGESQKLAAALFSLVSFPNHIPGYRWPGRLSQSLQNFAHSSTRTFLWIAWNIYCEYEFFRLGNWLLV